LQITFGSLFNIYHSTPILRCITGVGGGDASAPKKF